MNNLLKQKDISPLGKLFILHLNEVPSYIPYNCTSNEIAKMIGSTRTAVLIMLESAQINGYITSQIKAPIRITKLTKKALDLLNNN